MLLIHILWISFLAVCIPAQVILCPGEDGIFNCSFPGNEAVLRWEVTASDIESHPIQITFVASNTLNPAQSESSSTITVNGNTFEVVAELITISPEIRSTLRIHNTSADLDGTLVKCVSTRQIVSTLLYIIGVCLMRQLKNSSTELSIFSQDIHIHHTI